MSGIERLSDSLMQLSTKELKQWEHQVGFTSYASAQDSILDRLDQACNETEFWSIVYENPLYLKQGTEGIDNVFISPTLKHVANKEGIFCINNMYHKVLEDRMLSTEAMNIKDAILKFKENKGINTFEIANYNTPHKKSEGCGTDEIKSSKRSGDREVNVKLNIHTYRLSPTPCCVTYYQEATIEIVGKKTNWLGQFYTYSTTQSYSGLEIIFDRLDIVYAPYNCRNINGCPTQCDAAGFLKTKLTFPDYTSSEQKIFTQVLFRSKTIYNTPISTDTRFISAKVKAWTRGTNDNSYAAICCNYSYCGF
jgi:hypothetical protein